MNELGSRNELKEFENNFTNEKSFYNDSERPESRSFQPAGKGFSDVKSSYSDSDRDQSFEPFSKSFDSSMEHTDNASDLKESSLDKAETLAEKIPCRNEELAGSEHPETGVPFEKRQIEVDGKLYEVVTPKFESVYEVQLPDDKLTATDREQFKECNSQLKSEVAGNEELRNKFDEIQLEQIEDGYTPDGYTWHHDADVGKMQLVDSETHQKTGHTGGRSIWGGGSENR